MNNIKLLDCTLRDGGYINEWNFKQQNIKIITSNLTKAKIDYVECGFLEDFESYDLDKSLFNNVSQIEQVLPKEKGNTEFVAMTRFGNLDINNLQPYDGKSISGIRVTFHLEEMVDAIDFCKQVKAKGYKVFVQPVGTTSYSDQELLSLIEMVNKLNPYSFYIVDTLGVMKKNDIYRFFNLIDNNLEKSVTIGFHSHNNLQLSFSNAQELVSLHTKRTIFIDSSVYGMGRGAGNLNTELIAQYINTEYSEIYNISYILEIIDEYITGVRAEYDWGYSVPYYLAAIHNCHPNYATFLIKKKTLQVNEIAQILSLIPQEKRELYDKNLVDQLYVGFQNQYISDKEDISKLSHELSGKEILVIVPGKSLKNYHKEIIDYITKNNPIVISVQYIPEHYKPEYVFFSNRKRLSSFINEVSLTSRNYKLINTSNTIQENIVSDYTINYFDLLNENDRTKDNSTLMLLKLLERLQVKEIMLAGFDGYDIHSNNNYIMEAMENFLDEETIIELNKEISDFLSKFKGKINIDSITPSLYI